MFNIKCLLINIDVISVFLLDVFYCIYCYHVLLHFFYFFLFCFFTSAFCSNFGSGKHEIKTKDRTTRKQKERADELRAGGFKWKVRYFNYISQKQFFQFIIGIYYCFQHATILLFASLGLLLAAYWLYAFLRPLSTIPGIGVPSSGPLHSSPQRPSPQNSH